MLEEPYQRLMAVRERAGFATASDAARAFGWNENTYRSHENGERGIRPVAAAKYAFAFKSSAAYILVGEQQGEMSNVSRLILNGRVDEKGNVEILQRAANYETGNDIFATVSFREHSYAFEVVEDETMGFLSKGDLVVASNKDTGIGESLHRLCFVKSSEFAGRLTYVRSGSLEGSINIETSIRKPEILLRPISIHLVRAVLFKGQ